jgi:serine/threonine protein kinase
VTTFGRYRLIERLAAGGMAEVWRAEVDGGEGIRREVALKLVRGEHGASGDFARMLVEEARLAARLCHANVVQVLELCQDGDRYALVMELVRGHDLGRVVERCRELGLRLGVARAVQVGLEAARGLDHAHRLAVEGRSVGLVHRDVSPHNILVSREGEVKLADFGIARAAGQIGFTNPGTVKGKLAYMAPEQARGSPLDGRADVFALGVVLWELCAGRRLFARESEAATLHALLSDEPIGPASAWNEEVPPALDAVLQGALERDPARRTASAEELRRALARVQLELLRSPEESDLRTLMQRLWPEEPPRPVAAPEPTTIRPASGAPPGAVPALDATATILTPRRTRRRRGLALLALGAVASVAATLLVVRGSNRAAREDHGATADARSAPAIGAPPAPGPSVPAGDQPELQPLPGEDPDAAALGAGLVRVHATPWATVSADGTRIGETPRDLRLGAGSHRLRAEHPTLGAAELTLTVEPGRRLLWRPALKQ